MAFFKNIDIQPVVEETPDDDDDIPDADIDDPTPNHVMNHDVAPSNNHDDNILE